MQIHKQNKLYSLYFYKPWGNNGSRKLEMNFSCFGSFGKNDATALCYCETLGHIAGIFSHLENLMLFSDESKKLFNEYDALSNACYDIQRELDNLKLAVKEHNDELKKNDIMSKIAVGTKIIVRKASKYYPATIKTISHITAKNIVFKEDYGRRTNKDELDNNLMHGSWQIA